MKSTDIATIVMTTYLIVTDGILLGRGNCVSRPLRQCAKIQILSLSLGLALSILLHDLWY